MSFRADPQPRRDVLVVLLVSLIVGFAFQGTRHLFDPDEGRYTDVAHEMIELDDWLVPRLDPERPHFTKPPLTYWTLAASFRLFGSNEWAARLPNAVAFVGTALLVFAMARRLGFAAPAFAACAWATSWGPALGMNVVTTDTLLAACETIAVSGFVASGLVTGNARARPAGIRLMWLGFGLAFLTKGPPGLLPLAAIVAFVAWRRRGELARLFDPVGLLVFAVVGLTWFVVLVWHSPDLLDYFIRHETVGRVATAEHQRNAGWFGWLEVYPATLFLGTLPWLGLAMRVRWRRGPTAGQVPALGEDVRRFLALWLGLPLLVFVLAQSRLPLYVLPLMVPATLLVTAWLGDWPAQERRAHRAIILAAFVAIGIKGVGALAHLDGDASRLADEFRATVDMSNVGEVVFVDVPARYGLKHYLGINVEQTESRPGALGPAGYAAPETLCQELDLPEHQLLVVPARRADEVMATLTSCPHRVEPAGTLRKWALFRAVSQAR